MSMFDRYSDNDINLRLNETIINKLYLKNPETNNYDRFIPGSGSSAELPYYVKPDKIKLENESNFTEILESGININGQVLNQNNLAELNKIFNRTDVAHFVDKKFILYDPTLQNFRTAPVPSYLKFFMINFDNSLSSSFMNTDKINFSNKITTDYSEHLNSVFRMIKSPATISNIVEIKPESITLADHLENSNVPNSYYSQTIMNKSGFTSTSNNSLTYCSLSSTGISLGLSGKTSTALNHSSITNLNKFLNRTTTADMTNKKMLLFDSVSNDYHFSDIPSSGTLPSYLLPSTIRMNNLGTYAGFGNIEMFPADSDNFRSRAGLKVVEGGGSGPSSITVFGNAIRIHPAGPTSDNDLNLEYDHFKRLQKGPDVFSVSLSNNLKGGSGALMTVSGNTANMGSGEYSTYGSVKSISHPTSSFLPGDKIIIKIASSDTLSANTVYSFALGISGSTNATFSIVNSNLVSASVKKRTLSAATSTFTDIPVISFFSPVSLAASDVEITLSIDSFNSKTTITP